MKKILVKTIIFLAVLLVLIIGAAGALRWAFGMRSGEFYRVNVSVTEGFVDVYKYSLQGGREFLKTLHEGENMDVNGRVQKLSPIYEVIKSFIPSALQIIAEDIRVRASYVDRSQEASYLYSQKELNERIVWKMNGRGGLSDLQMSISDSGVEASAMVTKLGISVKVSGVGTVNVGESGRGDMHLKVQRAKIGPLPLPAPLLRGLEAAFSESLYEKPFPVKVTKMQYSANGVHVTFQGLADTAFAQKQVTHQKL